MRFAMFVRATEMTEAGKFPEGEAKERLLAAMGRYNEEMIKAGVLLDGAGLQPSAKGARVHFDGSQTSVVDGPFAEARELVAGYSIIEVKSKEEAIAWARRMPNPYGEDGKGIVEIRQLYELEDFGPSEAIEIHRQNAAAIERTA